MGSRWLPRTVALLLVVMLTAGCTVTVSGSGIPEAPNTPIITEGPVPVPNAYNSPEVTALWEKHLLQITGGAKERQTLATPSGTFTLVFLDAYSAGVRADLTRETEAALSVLPDQLLTALTGLHIYVNPDAGACGHATVAVTGCTTGGDSLLMIYPKRFIDHVGAK